MLISGSSIAAQIHQEIRKKIQNLSGRSPGLAMILVGIHPPSHAYVNMKKIACHEVGILSRVIQLHENLLQEELLATIEKLNQDETIDGILLQSPLPPHINAPEAFSAIDPTKDVDGFHPLNVGKLVLGTGDGFVPCTPLGVMEMLQRSNIDVSGKHAVVVGRSNIVGKPMALLLLQKNATVTVCHSKTKKIEEITRQGEILIAAVGKPHFITENMVREGAVVIDVGITRVDDPLVPKGYQLVGDVDFNTVSKKCKAISPVPKGVGPMTVAMLLQNTLQSYEQRCVSF